MLFLYEFGTKPGTGPNREHTRELGSCLPAWDLADSWLQRFPICRAGYFGTVPGAEFFLVPACDGNRSSRNRDPSLQRMRGPGKRHRGSRTGRSAARVRHVSTRTVSVQA